MTTADVTQAKGPGVVIHSEECKGCGRCIEACPNGVLAYSTQNNSHGYLTPEARQEGCTGCGICFYNCPEPGAITVYKKPKAKAGEAE